MQNDKPWDARLAYRLIYPFKDSSLSPNHFTWMRLFFGLAAFTGLAMGSFLWTNIGAFCFVLSNFMDHTDGEFARLTGKMTRFGHYFDLVSDTIVNILLFIGIGVGLMQSKLGVFALPMGIFAGFAVAAIFHMRLFIEEEIGKTDARQPNLGGMEAEDVLYLLPLVTLSSQLVPFLIMASIGAPLFSMWVLKEYLSLKKKLSK